MPRAFSNVVSSAAVALSLRFLMMSDVRVVARRHVIRAPDGMVDGQAHVVADHEVGDALAQVELGIGVARDELDLHHVVDPLLVGAGVPAAEDPGRTRAHRDEEALERDDVELLEDVADVPEKGAGGQVDGDG